MNKGGHSREVIKSCVHGKQLTITQDTLVAYFGCNSEGPSIDLKKEFHSPDDDWDPVLVMGKNGKNQTKVMHFVDASLLEKVPNKSTQAKNELRQLLENSQSQFPLLCSLSLPSSRPIEEDEFRFSRNYFLAKELGNSGKESGHKLADIDVVDEQDLREALANIEQKHEKEIGELIKSYKSLCGFGLEDFASTAKTEYSVVVLNSYLQSINLKQWSTLVFSDLYLECITACSVFNHLLDDSPLPANETSSSVLVATFSSTHSLNGKGSTGGGKLSGNGEVEKGLLTLISSDAPGLQAFRAMRARGARVIDIAVIVVATDVGIRPQIEEAIAHAKAAGMRIVIAINKVRLHLF
ncbi:uncharacterized protein LOC113766090 [Coffea eugenioides]|uniref:uncharacterized protein LOC113766090 n=1 Tax=Coffea eugenioides TaxID=49369 RepID=UPI000F608A49|nr:uncharacterized protein LOC113766090 [Coffea eugenioides]